MKKSKSIEDLVVDRITKFVRQVLVRVLKPNIIVNKVSDLTEHEIEQIKREYGIEAIILDVDDTLRTNMQAIPEVNQEWIDSLQGKIKVIILSNGTDRIIEEYFLSKGIDYIGFAHKPFKRNFVRACQKMGVKPENVMVVGDSLFNDVYGGKKNNMKTALVQDVEETR